MAVDTKKLEQFVGQFVTDLGATVHAGMVMIGDRLGLYKALAAGPLTAPELAAITRTDERYVREWLASQAAGGYITYNPQTHKLGMTEEQALTLANEDGPAYLPGAFELALGSLAAVRRITEAFRSGAGMGWGEHEDRVFTDARSSSVRATPRIWSSSWIPLSMASRTNSRAEQKVADVGCGKGASTILMAKAFPSPTSMDLTTMTSPLRRRENPPSVRGGGPGHVEVAKAKEYPGKDYDFVAVFDCLHDMGDPVGAAAHVRAALSDDGSWMIVEPFANDDLQDNLNPVGRVYYSFSTLLCTPCSRSQEVGMCLGAQAGKKQMQKVVNSAGFSRFRRATQTPFNLTERGGSLKSMRKGQKSAGTTPAPRGKSFGKHVDQ